MVSTIFSITSIFEILFFISHTDFTLIGVNIDMGNVTTDLRYNGNYGFDSSLIQAIFDYLYITNFILHFLWSPYRLGLDVCLNRHQHFQSPSQYRWGLNFDIALGSVTIHIIVPEVRELDINIGLFKLFLRVTPSFL